MNSKINYDMLSYVPSDLDSVKGFTVLTDDFKLGNTAQVMIVGSSESDVKRITDQVADIDGIEAVSWVDDVGDINVPREFWDTDGRRRVLLGRHDLLPGQLHGLGERPADPCGGRRDEGRSWVRRDYYIAGIQQIELEDVINGDRAKFAAAALMLVAIALLLTVPSVIVPVLFVITIGLAVVYNLGLSFYLGQEMSYLTGVIVLALQFAVTMDYALFLYHRYEQEREFSDNDTAMVTAMTATFKSVAGASLTTIAGFLASDRDAARVRHGHGPHARARRLHHRDRRAHGPAASVARVRRSRSAASRTRSICPTSTAWAAGSPGTPGSSASCSSWRSSRRSG